MEIVNKYRVSNYIKERVRVLERVLKWLFSDIEGKVVLDEYIKGVREDAYKRISGNDA